MAFTIPDKGEGQNDLQSILFQEYLDVLVAGINGLECVLSGGAVTAQGSPDMTVAVAKAAVLSNGALFAVAAGNGTITAANGTNPRLDLVVITSAGAIAVRAGTAAANPKPPARSANDVVLAVVYVPASDTTIGSDQITDMRIMVTGGPVVIKKTTTAVVHNTDSAAFTYFTVTLPSGLFLAGKILRVRLGGNYLLNSGTPLMTINVAYGGTSMFSDVSVIGAADADRGGWWMDFDLVAQANADQSVNGFITMANTPAGHIPGSVSGIGDILGSVAVAGRPVTTPFSGAAAVDSDTGDRALIVQWTMNVSNSADEIVMEYATAELL
jgi:hypothetical protein